MAQPITNIVITPQHTVLFQMPNILLSPRLETDQWLNQITPTGYTFISKNSNSGEITVSQNGLDYVFSVNLIEQVGLARFVPFKVPPEPQELELRTIEIYNELAERVFLGCCPCGDEDSGSGLLQYQLGSHNNNISRRTTYTSFLGQILGQLPPDETPVLAKFHRVSILWEYYLSISANTVDMDCVAVIRKNGIDTSHSVTIPAGDTGYFQIQGINETFTSTDTFSVRLTMPDAATGAINTSAGQGSYIIVQTATSGNPFGVLEVSGEVVDNDDPSIQYPKIRVFEPITREALLAKIAANEVKIRIYRITDALHTVVSGVDFYSTIDVEGLDTNVISILADNQTDDKVGEYTIGTSGNDDDTFTPQGGSGSQNLQQVTDVGNVTDNDMFIVKEAGSTTADLAVNIDGENAGASLQITSFGGNLEGATTVVNKDAISTQVFGNLATANRQLSYPDENGTLVLTVGGVSADSQGNVPISLAALNNLNATVAPTVTDDSSLGYTAGANASVWRDTITGQLYVCADASVGAAVWEIQGIGLKGTASGSPVTGVITATDFNGDPNIKIGVDPATDEYAVRGEYGANSFGLIIGVAAGGISYRDATYFTQLVIGSTGELSVSGDNPLFKGVVGQLDYSANYTPNTYIQKLYADTLQTAGNDITFDRPRQFGTFTTPLSGALTNTLTGAVIGKVQKIYHQDSSLTVPGTWVLISGTYNPSQKNIIYVEWSEGTRCEYWIVNL